VADNLRREWMRKFGVDIPEPPVVGDFDVSDVVRSPYFFS
jgi:DNA-directed RNA polymerase